MGKLVPTPATSRGKGAFKGVARADQTENHGMACNGAVEVQAKTRGINLPQYIQYTDVSLPAGVGDPL